MGIMPKTVIYWNKNMRNTKSRDRIQAGNAPFPLNTHNDRILSILLLVVGFSFGGWMLITDSIGWCPLITMFKFFLLVI
jgi:hypothetical protein